MCVRKCATVAALCRIYCALLAYSINKSTPRGCTRHAIQQGNSNKGRVVIIWDNVSQKFLKELGGDQEDVLSIEILGGD